MLFRSIGAVPLTTAIPLSNSTAKFPLESVKVTLEPLSEAVSNCSSLYNLKNFPCVQKYPSSINAKDLSITTLSGKAVLKLAFVFAYINLLIFLYF